VQSTYYDIHTVWGRHDHVDGINERLFISHAGLVRRLQFDVAIVVNVLMFITDEKWWKWLHMEDFLGNRVRRVEPQPG
jgi:hypothetical protein